MPEDLAAAIAFALRYAGRKRVHNADEIMSEIVAKRLVEHLQRDGFFVMRRATDPFGGAALGRGFGTHQRCERTYKTEITSIMTSPMAKGELLLKLAPQ